ncbi:MAG: UDP-N-acetylmuramoyl-tripeptide--D-alanyl-D-alanine ligase [Sphingobacteriaceae bacterium]|nr:UDP-N-acetylmuramoyl-tripeptide--D-alanyl-D-alanine ligase [Sphingobacteriaceae bacterium]
MGHRHMAVNTELLYQRLQAQGGAFTTDTRNIRPGDIFFALKGPSFNGNSFAAQALEQGAAWVVIDEPQAGLNERFMLVEDVLETLQALAAFHRRAIPGLRVIGITGSNGKTTTKELLKVAIASHYRCWATPGNLNNHIGVPITLLRMPLDTEVAVIEMGANHPGEVMPLCEIAQPDLGVVTSVGKEHLEGFGSLEAIIETECELYKYLAETGGQAFVHYENADLMAYTAKMRSAIYYGESKEADCVGRLLDADWQLRFQWENSYRLMLRAPQVETKLYGRYNFVNLLAAACVARHLSVPYHKINEALASYEPANNRSQLLELHGNRIILDAYNANPHSMQAAVENLAGIRSSQRVAVFGDMFELGDAAEAEHLALLTLMQEQGIEEALLCGPLFGAHAHAFPAYKFYQDLPGLKAAQPLSLFKDAVILVKGSRGMAMEKYVTSD